MEETPRQDALEPAPEVGGLARHLPRRPGHWLALVACLSGCAAVVAWSWEAWVWVFEHWRLSLTLVGITGGWLLVQHRRLTRARERILEVVEDAPSALTARQILKVTSDQFAAEIIQARLADLVRTGELEVCGLDEPGRPIRYRQGTSEDLLGEREAVT